MQPSNSSISTRLETARLYLRDFAPGDGEWYYAVGQRNRAHLQRYESGNPALEARSVAHAESIVRDIVAASASGRVHFLAGFDKATDEFIVQIYIGTVNAQLPDYEIGYFVDEAHEGRGYVVEAVNAVLSFLFETLGAHRVSLECDDTNTRSWRVAERCGFVQEGHRRENKQRADGPYSGTLYYGLLRSEYEAARSAAKQPAG